MAPSATLTTVPVIGDDFLEPKFDVVLNELLDGTPEDVEEEDLAFRTMRTSSARGAASESPCYITMSSCCPGESVSVLKST